MNTKKLLCVNLYYNPNSYGGATIVAERLNQILREKYGWEIFVITSSQTKNAVGYSVKKYFKDEETIFAINLPHNLTWEESYSHDKYANIILDISKKIKPDLVHGHAIQMMGAAFLEKLSALNIPKVITAHDCWWFCDRLFMINNHGKYCFQSKIDPAICLHCMGMLEENIKRMDYLKAIAKKVDLFLYPSQFHRDKYIENGWVENTSKVSKNGVVFPKVNYVKKKSTVTRFGFVGGPGYIKGGNLIKEAFKEVKGEYSLHVVDAARNRGDSWENEFLSWNIPSHKLEIIPPYTMETLDDFYSNIDVLLFPSQWKESFGLTVREALRRDVWIISTDGGGTVEDLRAGENATIIPIGNSPSLLIDAINNCIKKNWADYSNPYKNDIISFEDQAEELNNYYLTLLESKKFETERISKSNQLQNTL